MAKVLLQACSRIPGCPWCNPGGKGRDAERPLSPAAEGSVELSWWMHVAVPAGPQGLGTITVGADACRRACSPCSVAAYTQSPGRGLRLVAGADSFAGASHPAEKPGASQQPGSEQQGLQGSVKRLVCWGGVWWSPSRGRAGTLRRHCLSCQCPPCRCSRSPPARPRSQHPRGGRSHQS